MLRVALSWCVAAATCCATLWAQCPDGTPPPCAGARAPMPILVVEPFANRSRDTADAYLAATLTEDVTDALGASHAVRLISPRGSRHGAEFLLSASVRHAGAAVQLAARLERAGSREILWTQTLEESAAQGAGAADTLAARVLARLGIRRRAPPRTVRPVDPVVHDLYLRGRYYARRRNAADIARGIRLLQQAVATDSTLAPAWAAIVRVLYYAGSWHIPVPGVPADSVRTYELEASERALLSDSGSAEIWIARSLALRDLEPTSRAAPLRALRRALMLDSLDANVWSALGYALEEAGDTAAALAAFRRSLVLDGANTEALLDGTLHFYWARQLDSAAAWADSLVATDPTYISGRRLMGTIALARGRLDQAEAQFTAARTIGPGVERIWSLAGLACVAAARSDTATARRLVREMEALTDSTKPSLHGAIFIAWGHAALGEPARALDWLERFRPSGDLHFHQHLLDQPLDPLRAQPRFQALLAAH